MRNIRTLGLSVIQALCAVALFVLAVFRAAVPQVLGVFLSTVLLLILLFLIYLTYQTARKNGGKDD